jgi:hypothetical protein
MCNNDLVNTRIRDTSKSHERVLNKLKMKLFSLHLVYFLIQTEVTFYALVSVDNSPFIWCMAKLGANHYIEWYLFGLIYWPAHTQEKYSACLVQVKLHVCLQHSENDVSNSWILKLHAVSHIYGTYKMVYQQKWRLLVII